MNMPASSYRRLQLLSSSVIRDSKRIIVHPQNNHNVFIVGRYNRRDMTTSSSRLIFASTTGSSGAGRTRLLSTLSNSYFSDHHHRQQQQRRCPNANTTKSSMTLTSRAHFHSSPLSWFAADDNKEEEEPKKEEEEEKEKDVTTTAADNKEEPKEEEEKDVTTTETTSSKDADGDNNTNTGDDDTNEEPSATDVTYDFTPPAPLSQDSQDKVQAIFDKVLFLDMIEVHLLTQIVNEQMGISWKETEQRTSGRGGGGVSKKGAADASADEPVEEKTIFDLKLLGFDAKSKIKVIKEVRNIAGLGLKEAKEMVEGAPKVIQKELKKEKAEELKLQLEAVGATVELV
jgi:large subunit ribosomal protein L7/L12